MLERPNVKRTYVRVVHSARDVMIRTGRMRALDAWAERSRAGTWWRSLFAIYDVDALVDLDVPWWTFAASELVEQHLEERPAARVFEWGSGASTAWLARRAAHVTAVEHDPVWARRVAALVGTGCTVLTVAPSTKGSSTRFGSRKRGFTDLDFAEYVLAIDATDDDYDLIVIDGRSRESCLDRALDHLAADGIIVFDNVDRRRYRAAIAGHPEVEVCWTRGLTPALLYPTRTALLRRSVRP